MPSAAKKLNLLDDALRYLARREYYREELAQKLVRRGHERDTVDEALEQLTKEGKLSEQRYIEAYIFAQQRKLYGPQWIYLQLVQKGLDEDVVKTMLDEQSINWSENMERYYHKRFKEAPSDAEQRAKVKNSLYRKGYPHDLIKQFLSEHTAS